MCTPHTFLIIFDDDKYGDSLACSFVSANQASIRPRLGTPAGSGRLGWHSSQQSASLKPRAVTRRTERLVQWFRFTSAKVILLFRSVYTLYTYSCTVGKVLLLLLLLLQSVLTADSSTISIILFREKWYHLVWL